MTDATTQPIRSPLPPWPRDVRTARMIRLESEKRAAANAIASEKKTMTDSEIAVAVAKRCGWEHVGFMNTIAVVSTPDRCLFDPANYWDHAMLAAEKCGLFDAPYAAQLEKASNGRWCVTFDDPTIKGDHGVVGVDAETGPRVIVAAILSMPVTT